MTTIPVCHCILHAGKNGRPNLTVANGKDAPTSDNSNKPGGQRIITGPDGTKWVGKGLLPPIHVLIHEIPAAGRV